MEEEVHGNIRYIYASLVVEGTELTKRSKVNVLGCGRLGAASLITVPRKE